MKTPTLSLLALLLAAAALAQQPQKSGNVADDPRLKRFDKNGDGKIDDSERAATREWMRKRQQKPDAMTPSGKTETVGNRLVTEMEYASADGRKIPCVLSMPQGDGPFPCVVTIHGGQGNRDLGYIRTLAAPNPVSPTVNTLNEQPWAVLAISYRAGEGVMSEGEQADVVAGIRFAKSLPKIDPSRVGVLGGSHGGHLALRAAELMGKEFLCVAVGSPWMTNPVVYMTGKADQPPLSLLAAPVHEALMKNGAQLLRGMKTRGLSDAEVRAFQEKNSIEAHAEKIVIPSLFMTSLADEQAPHLLVKPTFDKLMAAGREVTVFTVEKSPHGFYWGRNVGGSRIGKGEKSEAELAEEKATREQIVAFFTKQLARTDVQDVASPKPSAATVAAPATQTASDGDEAHARREQMKKRPAESRGTTDSPATKPSPATTSSGDAPMTKEQFKERFGNTGALADRPEVVERIFNRLDENKDGVLSADELAKMKTLRGGGAGARPGKPAETPPAPTPKSETKPSAEAQPAPETKASETPYVKKTLTPEQAGAIRKMRERMAHMPVPEKLTRRTLNVGDKEREFFIHIPASAKDKPASVVFVLHGGASSSGLAMHAKTDFTELADIEGYVTVYPSGVTGWNVGSHDSYSVKRRTSDADDVGFFRAMFDTLITEKVADPKRIYVTGGSNGGVMTQFLVCNLADRIAGAGVVVATLPRAAATDWPKPARPVPTLIMLGTVDPMKPWAGNADQMSADETLSYWRTQNTCTTDVKKWDLPDRDAADGTRVHAQRWEGQAPVVFYTLEGHGHGWPMQRDHAETGTGPKTRDITAPVEFWTFFKAAAK
jgi:polyhydroxybutyrate depolymerase